MFYSWWWFALSSKTANSRILLSLVGKLTVALQSHSKEWVTQWFQKAVVARKCWWELMSIIDMVRHPHARLVLRILQRQNLEGMHASYTWFGWIRCSGLRNIQTSWDHAWNQPLLGELVDSDLATDIWVGSKTRACDKNRYVLFTTCIYLYLLICMGGHRYAMRGDQGKICETHFSLSTSMQVLGLELTSSGLVAHTITHRAILPATVYSLKTACMF